MTLNFNANRILAAAFAVALSVATMAAAIVPGSPAGLIA